MSLETPQEVIFFRGGSSHARGKRPPEVEINGVRRQDKRHSRETHDYANFLKPIHHYQHHTNASFSFSLENKYALG